MPVFLLSFDTSSLAINSQNSENCYLTGRWGRVNNVSDIALKAQKNILSLDV